MNSVAMTVGGLMDALEPMNSGSTVVTDCGDAIFTLSPERDDDHDHAQVAALSLSTTEDKAPTVGEVTAMFAYYNVPTPRRTGGCSPCRTSRIVIRPMGDRERVITAITAHDDKVILTTQNATA